MPIDAEALPAAAPMTRHGQLEVDAFCAGCGYNLHGQIVSLDDRLGFPICRCPECGRYHPAGAAVTSHSVWLRRFGAILLAVWVLFVLLTFFILMLAMGAMQAAYVENASYSQWVYPDGRPLTLAANGQWVIAGTNTPAPNTRIVRTNQPPPGTSQETFDNRRNSLVTFCVIAIFIGFAAGILLVTFLWHWPRWRYAVGLLLPMLTSAFVLCSYLTDQSFSSILPWVTGRILMVASIEAAGIIPGILLGRKISRGIVRTIIPPKLRQMLAFLWLADDLPPPPVSGNNI